MCVTSEWRAAPKPACEWFQTATLLSKIPLHTGIGPAGLALFLWPFVFLMKGFVSKPRKVLNSKFCLHIWSAGMCHCLRVSCCEKAP